MGRKSKRKKLKRAPRETHGELGVSRQKETYRREKSGSALFLIEIIRWGAFIALFAPLIVHPDFFFPFVVPKAVFFWIFVEIISFVWLLLAIPNKQFRPSWNGLSLSLGLFLVITIFTSFTGINTERSFWSTFERMAGTVNWIHLVLFFFVLTSTFKNLADWKKFVTVSFIVAGVVSFIFLLERIGISVLPFESRNGATIGNSSFMAAYLLFNVFFGIWLFVKAKLDWTKILYGIGVGMVVLSILTAYAYGAMVSMFGGFFIIFLAWLFFGSKFRFAKQSALVFLGAGIVVAAIVGYGTFSQNAAITSKLPYLFSNAGTIGARKVVWAKAWQGIKERPILGWGPENFNVVFSKYFNPCMPLSICGGEVWYDRTHNTFLDHWIHSGIIGLLSFLSIFAAGVWILWKKILRDKEWLLPSVIVAALISYFVQNLLVFDMPSTYIMFVFTLALAACLGGIRAEEKKWEALKLPSPFTIVVTGLFAVYFLFSWGVQSLQAANWGIVINRGLMAPEKRLEIYKKKLSVSPLGNRQVPEFFTNNMVTNLNSGTNMPANFVKEAGEIMGDILARNPLDFRHYLILGNYYTAAKGYDSSYLDKAEDFLTKAVELSPRNQLGYTALGQVYLMKGENENSLEFFKKAAELEPRFEKPRFDLAASYSEVGEYRKAKEVYEKLFSELFSGEGKIPVNTSIILRMVDVYDELKEYDTAITWLLGVAESEVKKNDGNIHFKLAKLYKKGGYKDEAKSSAARAKELDASLKDAVADFLKELK